MGSVTKLERMNIRIDSDLKERFTAICESKSINASALMRKWIEEFVEEHERPLVSMDILDIVWKLNKERNESINAVCDEVADNLGYDGAPMELFDDVVGLLSERSKVNGSLNETSFDHKHGWVESNNERIYFSIIKDKGVWSIEPKKVWIDFNKSE